jgi:uncharacterized SAM-binding protein YcdF (DUF218 family)
MRAALLPLILPPGGPLLLALLGLLLLRLGWRHGARVALLGLLLAWALSMVVVVEPMARLYTGAPVTPQVQHWRGDKDALVLVLGAGVHLAGPVEGAYELKERTAERLRRGLWWSRQLDLPLAFSGGIGTQAEPGQPSEASVVETTLKSLGLPALRWAEGKSVDTRGNARHSAVELHRHRSRKVLLVTDDLHMPRAIKHFRLAAPELEFVAAPLMQHAGDDWRWQDFLPSSRAAQRAHYLAYELAARLAGH